MALVVYSLGLSKKQNQQICVCVCVCVCVCRERETYFKELAHMIVEAWQSRLETEGRVVVCVSRQSAGTIFSFSGAIRLCFIKARFFVEAFPHYRGQCALPKVHQLYC